MKMKFSRTVKIQQYLLSECFNKIQVKFPFYYKVNEAWLMYAGSLSGVFLPTTQFPAF